MRKKGVFLSIALICLILAAAPCAAQPLPTQGVKYFLNIDGIKGESQEDQHKDWIEVLSYADGVSQGFNPAYSPLNMRSYMEPGFASITITKIIDIASPKLMEAASKGTHIPNAKMEVYYNGFKFWTVNLEDVVISSVEAQIPETLLTCDVAPVAETVSLNYGKIEWTYTQQKRADGSGGGNTTAKYDLTKAKAAQ
jgi:type VI secretion system secreted protein Hcp